MKKVPVPPSTKHKAASGGVGAGIGAMLFTVIATWLGVDDELTLMLITGAGGVFGGALGSYLVRNYITDPEVIRLLENLDSRIRQRGGIRCHPLAVVTALALVLSLSACASDGEGVELDGSISDTERVYLDNAKLVALTTLVSLNQSGIDPLRVPTGYLDTARLGCLVVSSGIVVRYEGDPEIGLELQSWCEIFLRAAGAAR